VATDPVRRAAAVPGADDDQLATMGLPIQVHPDLDLTTIGVAVQIPDPWGQQLQELRGRFGDSQASAIPAHVTLLPPTAVSPADLDLVTAHLARVAAATQAFELRLEGTGTFRPVSPVVYVRVTRGAAGCDALQQGIRSGPVNRDLAFPYHPHVTVAQDLDEQSLDRAFSTLSTFSASFVVRAFWLYEHGADGVWRPRQPFPFPLATTAADGLTLGGIGPS
jgi:2'-5' RNA ligase